MYRERFSMGDLLGMSNEYRLTWNTFHKIMRKIICIIQSSHKNSLRLRWWRNVAEYTEIHKKQGMNKTFYYSFTEERIVLHLGGDDELQFFVDRPFLFGITEAVHESLQIRIIFNGRFTGAQV